MLARRTPDEGHVDRHKDGTIKATGHTVDDVPDAQCIARRCVKTTVTSKISAAGDISIPGRNFHGGDVRNIAMNGDGF
jgi:hypothetical protein